jgi:hypothetical protein
MSKIDWTKPIQVRTPGGVYSVINAYVTDHEGSSAYFVKWNELNGEHDGGWMQYFNPDGTCRSYDGITVENVPEPEPAWHQGSEPHSGVGWYAVTTNTKATIVLGYCARREWIYPSGKEAQWSLPLLHVGPTVKPPGDWPKLEPIPEELPLPRVGWCDYRDAPAVFAEHNGFMTVFQNGEYGIASSPENARVANIRYADGKGGDT